MHSTCHSSGPTFRRESRLTNHSRRPAESLAIQRSNEPSLSITTLCSSAPWPPLSFAVRHSRFDGEASQQVR